MSENILYSNNRRNEADLSHDKDPNDTGEVDDNTGKLAETETGTTKTKTKQQKQTPAKTASHAKHYMQLLVQALILANDVHHLW